MMKLSAQLLVAAHMCAKCAQSFTFQQINDDAGVTGLVTCPYCGHTGALEVVIVKSTAVTKLPKTS